jgi:DNA-binding transcriptional regulator WhiA
MAMTAQVKAELANTTITKSCCRKAEVSSILRFSGGLHIVSGRIVVEAELDTGSAARRLGIQAKAREVRGVDRVVIRDGDTIAALLTRMGAHDALMVWEERRMRKEVRATANRLANFDDANLRRSAQAAVAAGARVDRALEILGDDVPDHLKYAGELRVAHKQASLDELGRLADPPMTKDAIAGRIRRLLAMADKRALDLGIPGTEANVTPEMLDE